MRCSAHARATKCSARKKREHADKTLKYNVEKWGHHTRNVSDTRTGAFCRLSKLSRRGHMQSLFGRLRRVSRETPAQEMDPEDPSMDCKPSSLRRKGVLARGRTWAEARPTHCGHTVDGARPSKTHVNRREPEAKACVRTPYPTTLARLPRRKDISSGALERTERRLGDLHRVVVFEG